MSEPRGEGRRRETPRPGELRVGVVGMGIGQSHLLSWLDVDGASATVFAELDDDKRAKGEADLGHPGCRIARRSPRPATRHTRST